jgi:uncharacterized protein (DUF486 family)
MQTPRSPLQLPTRGNQITVLSIDGGGIRGIIPGTILAFLESELQVEKKTGSFSTYTNACQIDMQDLACFCVFGFMIIYNKKKIKLNAWRKFNTK